jgi:hypothetical protein
MAALTADRKHLSKWTGRAIVGKVAASTTIYAGSLVAKDSDGYIVPAADTASLTVVGLAMGYVDNSAGADGAKTVQIETGVYKFKNGGSAAVDQATVHGLCYVADDQTVGKTTVESIVAGVVDQLDSDGVWVSVGIDVSLTA